MTLPAQAQTVFARPAKAAIVRGEVVCAPALDGGQLVSPPPPLLAG